MPVLSRFKSIEFCASKQRRADWYDTWPPGPKLLQPTTRIDNFVLQPIGGYVDMASKILSPCQTTQAVQGGPPASSICAYMRATDIRAGDNCMTNLVDKPATGTPMSSRLRDTCNRRFPINETGQSLLARLLQQYKLQRQITTTYTNISSRDKHIYHAARQIPTFSVTTKTNSQWLRFRIKNKLIEYFTRKQRRLFIYAAGSPAAKP